MEKQHFKDLAVGDYLCDMHSYTSLRDDRVRTDGDLRVIEPVVFVDIVGVRGPGGGEFINGVVAASGYARDREYRYRYTNKGLVVVDITEDGDRIVAYSYDDRNLRLARMKLAEPEAT